MNNIIEKIRHFMKGRYGVDELNTTLLFISIFLSLISNLFKINLLSLISTIITFYVLYRMFSKNINKRLIEYRKYKQIKDKVTSKINYLKRRYDDRNTYRYFTCPNCKQKVRVPVKQGKIEITCPKCYTKFEKIT